MKKILFVFGTRPEAIKLAPVYCLIKNSKSFQPIICITAQHRQMLDQVLELFQIRPDYDLDIMQPNQNLSQLSSKLLTHLSQVVKTASPDLVVVHGDTTTTAIASLVAYFEQKPLAHVEAGLRTFNKYSPWPEEINRKITGCIADLHFAPTVQAKENLLKENICEDSITITGNTVIDALMLIKQKINEMPHLIEELNLKYPFMKSNLKKILVTCHRRESFGPSMESVLKSIKRILLENDDVQIVFPVHLNPHVRNSVENILGEIAHQPGSRLYLLEPLDYLSFVYIMSQSIIILSDSGGIQEEAPSFGVPVLVLRDTTERPEGIEAGVCTLVGTDEHTIINAVNKILNSARANLANIVEKKINNPFGDGKASQRIISAIEQYFEIKK